eukprot:gene8454-biopygen9434
MLALTAQDPYCRGVCSTAAAMRRSSRRVQGENDMRYNKSNTVCVSVTLRVTDTQTDRRTECVRLSVSLCVCNTQCVTQKLQFQRLVEDL